MPSTFELYTAPKLSHIDFLVFRSRDRSKSLAHPTESQTVQKKLVLNKTNKSFMWSWTFLLSCTCWTFR